MTEIIGYEWCVIDTDTNIRLSEYFNTPAEAEGWLEQAKKDFPYMAPVLKIRKVQIIRTITEERKWAYE